MKLREQTQLRRDEKDDLAKAAEAERSGKPNLAVMPRLAAQASRMVREVRVKHARSKKGK